MSKLRAIGRFTLAEFGPMLAFWALALSIGVRAAIIGAIAFIAFDSFWRWRRGLAFTRLYLVTSGLTLSFGAVDLCAATPFMFKYEAVITNIATGAAFVVGAFGTRPMLQEVAEQRQGLAFGDNAEIRRFFQLFTLFWAAYFFAKAGLYVWLVWTLSLLRAMALRSILGGVSLGLMTALSVTQGRRMFFLCRALGWLPAPLEDSAARAA